MEKTVNRSLAMKWAIVLILTAICAMVPEQGLYTHEVKMFLVVTVFGLAASAFELMPDLFVAIILPAGWILFQVAPAANIFSPWVGTTIFMILGAFVMAAALDDCGILKRIAYSLMYKVKGSYFSLLVGLMVCGVVINVLTSGRGYLIMAVLGAGLCISMQKMKTKFAVGVCTAVMLGGATAHSYTYLSSTWAVITKMGADYISSTDITPLTISLHNWPLFFVSLLILFVISKWYKPEEDLSDITYFRDKLDEMGPMTRNEIWNIAMMALLILYIFTVSFHKFDIALGFMIIPWLVYLPGIEAASKQSLKTINFSMLFFIGSCMGIGTVATYLGLGDALMVVCLDILHGNSSPIAIMAIIFAIVFLLNFAMTPLAIFALITSPMLALAVSLGYSPIPFAYAVNACAEAILLPYEYVPYLIIFSFGMISMKDFIKVNILRSVLFFGGFLLVLVPYWMLIGLL